MAKAKITAPLSASKAPVQNMPWEEAIQTVLAGAGAALHYAEIAERIVAKNLRKSVGATPAATVASYLSKSLSEASSPFLRVGKGEYTLKNISLVVGPQAATGASETVDPSQTGALRAFGMFWQRDSVMWSAKAKLLGRQGAGATDVNFATQVGVYLLHDRERVIYVGRATDTLFNRLKAHTGDRLGGRWDRFSWFGLRSVGTDGELSDDIMPWSQEVVVETMEAVLIESLEPPLNRKRGDNFSGAEYVQVSDPAIEAAKKKAIITELLKSVDPTA